MSTKQIQIKSTILRLLDEGYSDKNKIYEVIQNDFDVPKSEVRLACKEVKIDLILKLKVLQSGMLEL